MVKRKRIIACTLLCLLVTPIIGLIFVDLVRANPDVGVSVAVPRAPVTAKPIITLLTPINGTDSFNNTLINFNVATPPQWYWSNYSYLGVTYSIGPCGVINNASCTLDGKEISYNDTIYEWNGCQTVYGWDEDMGLNESDNCTCNSQISQGIHNLTISVNATTWYTPSGVAGATGDAPLYNYDVSTNETFTFEVGAPTISNLSIGNNTYFSSTVPLTFDVDRMASWIGYSLDNQLNTTINGNLTLTNLAEGNHSLTLYANDTFGNIGKSDIVYFIVDTNPLNISNLSVENKTCNTTQVPLTFNTNENTSWIGYSLDYQPNQTVNGNFTLTGLPVGTHSLVIYANDTFGVMEKSNTAYFTIANPTPLPNKPTGYELSNWISYAIIAVVVLLGVSALIYFEKRKREP